MYDTDYPTEPCGKGNPYYRCVYCKKTDPQINGVLENHFPDCEYRIEKEKVINGENLRAIWIIFDKNSPECGKYDEDDLEDLALRIISYEDNEKLEEEVFEKLLYMEVGTAKLINNQKVVKILVPWK